MIKVTQQDLAAMRWATIYYRFAAICFGVLICLGVPLFGHPSFEAVVFFSGGLACFFSVMAHLITRGMSPDPKERLVKRQILGKWMSLEQSLRRFPLTPEEAGIFRPWAINTLAPLARRATNAFRYRDELRRKASEDNTNANDSTTAQDNNVSLQEQYREANGEAAAMYQAFATLWDYLAGPQSQGGVGILHNDAEIHDPKQFLEWIEACDEEFASR